MGGAEELVEEGELSIGVRLQKRAKKGKGGAREGDRREERIFRQSTFGARGSEIPFLFLYLSFASSRNVA